MTVSYIVDRASEIGPSAVYRYVVYEYSAVEIFNRLTESCAVWRDLDALEAEELGRGMQPLTVVDVSQVGEDLGFLWHFFR